jgi:hypothetical protein
MTFKITYVEIEFAVADSLQEIDKAVKSYEFLGLLLSKAPFYNC